jgi:hypothetical protein
MGLAASNDIKMDLLKKSARHRQELQKEVELISERTQTVLTNALIIGGTLAAAYFLVRQFSGSSKKPKVKTARLSVLPAREASAEVEEPSSPGMMSQIGTALASQATFFLLGLAKEKLSEYLQAQMGTKPKEDERP